MAEELPSWKKAVAELIGTMTLILIGVLVLSVGGGGKHLIEVALAHGLAIAVMVSATMSVSGGQLNPAVTIGLLSVKKISPQQAAYNIVGQLVGGVVGGYLAWACLNFANVGGTPVIVFGVPDLAPGVAVTTGILIEAILTFFLMFVVMGTGVDPRFGARLGGLAIGFTVALDIMAGGPLTGAAMNPARWFGAALPAGHYGASGVWLVYTVGPILGAIIAATIYDSVLLEKPRPHPEPAAAMRSHDDL